MRLRLWHYAKHKPMLFLGPIARVLVTTLPKENADERPKATIREREPVEDRLNMAGSGPYTRHATYSMLRKRLVLTVCVLTTTSGCVLPELGEETGDVGGAGMAGWTGSSAAQNTGNNGGTGGTTSARPTAGGSSGIDDPSNTGGVSSIGEILNTGGRSSNGEVSSNGGTTGASSAITNSGGSGIGGAAAPVAGNAGRGSNNQSSCVQGVDTGDACNAAIDTTQCVRSTRTCTCSAQTQKWACTPNGVGGAGNGGNSGRGGSAGAPPNIAGNAGLAGFAGAGLPVAASCRRNSACSTEGQFCDKSMSADPRYCTCTNGDWACVDA